MKSCLIHPFGKNWLVGNIKYMKCKRCGLVVSKKVKKLAPTTIKDKEQE